MSDEDLPPEEGRDPKDRKRRAAGDEDAPPARPDAPAEPGAERHPEPEIGWFDEEAWEGLLPPGRRAGPVDEDDDEDGDDEDGSRRTPGAPPADLLHPEDAAADEDDDEDDDEAEPESEEAEEQRFTFRAAPAGVVVQPGVFSSMDGLENELAASRSAVESFTLDAARAVGAEVRPGDGHVLVEFPREVPRGVRRKRRLVFALADMGEGTELAAPGSRFLRELTDMAKGRAPVALAAGDVPRPRNVFHYRIALAGLHYKHEEVVTVCLDDIGLREDAPDPANLAPASNAAADDADLDLLEDAAKRAMLKQVAPKLDELSSAVTAGLEAALNRITRYYGQLREEARLEEAKVRRRIGELNARLWFTEDGLRERKMEKERDDLQRSLGEIRQRNKHRLEELEAEEAVRLSRESEKHRPRVRLELVGVTRVVPRAAAGAVGEAPARDGEPGGADDGPAAHPADPRGDPDEAPSAT